MKLRALFEDTIVQTGQDHLVISLWDQMEHTEQFYVISDVPRITRKQYYKLFGATFGSMLNDEIASTIDITPYNLIGDGGGPMTNNFGVPGKRDWSDQAINIRPEDVKDQKYTLLKWKEFATMVLTDHPKEWDDFDE